MNDQQQPWWHQADSSSEDADPSKVGTSAQEAIRLAAALSEWASRTGLTETLGGIAMQAATGVSAAAKAAQQGRDGQSAADPAVPDETVDAPEQSSAQEQPGPSGGPDTSSATCDFCPVCQGMNLLRVVSPEAATGMAEALSAVTDVILAALDTLSTPADSPSRVEHIDLD